MGFTISLTGLLEFMSWVVGFGFLGFILSYFINILRPFRLPLAVIWILGTILIVVIQVYILIG